MIAEDEDLRRLKNRATKLLIRSSGTDGRYHIRCQLLTEEDLPVKGASIEMEDEEGSVERVETDELGTAGFRIEPKEGADLIDGRTIINFYVRGTSLSAWKIFFKWPREWKNRGD